VAAEEDNAGDLSEEVVVGVDTVYAREKEDQGCLGDPAGDRPSSSGGTDDCALWVVVQVFWPLPRFDLAKPASTIIFTTARASFGPTNKIL
jgi:hypothetical protein